MGIGVIVVKKEFQGEEWVNTYPFSVGGPGALSEADLTAIGMDRDFTNSGTTPGDVNYGDAGVGPIPLAYAVVGWERQMHATQVQFNSIYVTDKLENSAITDLGANTFAVKPLSFPGRRDIAAPAPGNIALMVNRVPAVFSRRAGRLYLRGCLNRDDVSFLGRGLLDWTSNAAKTAMQTYLQAQLDQSGMSAYFQGGLGVGELGIGRYRRGVQIPPNDVGDLYETVQLEGFRVQKPVSRQVKRGRRSNP